MHIDLNTAVTLPVNILPLTDDTDFKTLETAIAYNQAGMTLLWNFVTPNGTVTQTAVTPTTSGGDYDWTHDGNAMYKIGVPASGGASINNNTAGSGYFTGNCDGVLPWRSQTFTFRDSGLNDKLIEDAYSTTRGLAGTHLDVSVASRHASGADVGLSSSAITAIEAALLNEGDGQQLIDAILQVINSNLDLPALELTAIAQQVRTELSTELARIDAAISSRATPGAQMDIVDAPNATAVSVVQSGLSTFNHSINQVTVSTNNDKTGYGLSTDAITAIEAALLNEGDGQQLIDAILQVINSNLDLPALELTAIAQAVWQYATRTLSASDNLNDLDSAEVQSAVTAALVAIHLDHLLAVDYDPESKPGIGTALLNELIESNSGVSILTAAALAQAPTGGGGGLTIADLYAANSQTIQDNSAIKDAQGSAGGPATVGAFEAAALLQLSGLLVVVQSAFDPRKHKLTLKKGDDYLIAAGTAAKLTNANNTWHDLSTVNTIRLAGIRGGASMEMSATVTSVSDPQEISVECSAAEWNSIQDGDWKCDLEATLNSGHTLTITEVTTEVREDYAT